MKGDNAMAKFANIINDEQETIINIDYTTNLVYVYTSQKSVYKRLVKKLGTPNKIGYIRKKIVSGTWAISFENRKTITQLLSRSTLLDEDQ